MHERDELAECVCADPLTEVREVSISAFNVDDIANVCSTNPGLTRRLPRQELAVIENVELLADHTYESVLLKNARARDNPDVVGVDVEVPIGALKIGSTARSNDRLTNIVSP
jgi:hypothetical protein